MRRYALASGTLFGLISVAQGIRAVTASPARVGGFDIPVWWSVVACLVTAGFAVWAFRTVKRAA